MLNFLLAPASWLYKMAVLFRHQLFDWGVLRSEKFDILDKIRNLHGDNKYPITLSIGLVQSRPKMSMEALGSLAQSHLGGSAGGAVACHLTGNRHQELLEGLLLEYIRRCVVLALAFHPPVFRIPIGCNRSAVSGMACAVCTVVSARKSPYSVLDGC